MQRANRSARYATVRVDRSVQYIAWSRRSRRTPGWTVIVVCLNSFRAPWWRQGRMFPQGGGGVSWYGNQTNAGVPQGTLAAPASFLLHINDLQTVANSVQHIDDHGIWEVCAADAHNSQIQVATDQAADWATKQKLDEDKCGQDDGNWSSPSLARERRYQQSPHGTPH